MLATVHSYRLLVKYVHYITNNKKPPLVSNIHSHSIVSNREPHRKRAAGENWIGLEGKAQWHCFIAITTLDGSRWLVTDRREGGGAQQIKFPHNQRPGD